MLGKSGYERLKVQAYSIFSEGAHPGSDEIWVDVSSPVGLGCLQHRLNGLDAGIRIEMYSE